MFKNKFATVEAFENAFNVALSEVQAVGYREFVRTFPVKHRALVAFMLDGEVAAGRITISGDGRKGSPKMIRKTLAQPPSANVEPRSE